MDAKECLEILNAAQYFNDCAILPDEILRQKYGDIETVTKEIVAAGPKLLKFVIENIRVLEKVPIEKPPASSNSDGPAKKKIGRPAKSKRGRPAKKKLGRPPKIKATPTEKKKSANSSQHKGVSLVKKTGKWRGQVWFGGKIHSLGRFEKELEAAAAVQDFLGNKHAARKLRAEITDREAMANHNSKKNAGKKQQANRRLGDFNTAGYECVGCSHETVDKPQSCAKCGGSAFEKLMVENEESI